VLEIKSDSKVKNIDIICPVCKSRKDIKVPETVINQNSQLTTISIPKNLICNHHFQAFVDKQFKVRGYQKTDFELPHNKPNEDREIKEKNNSDNFNNNKLFENLTLEENFVEYKPKNLENEPLKDNIILNANNEKNEKIEKNLEKIYNEFWEFIDDDNLEFKELILRDTKRREALKNDII